VGGIINPGEYAAHEKNKFYNGRREDCMIDPSMSKSSGFHVSHGIAIEPSQQADLVISGGRREVLLSSLLEQILQHFLVFNFMLGAESIIDFLEEHFAEREEEFIGVVDVETMLFYGGTIVCNDHDLNIEQMDELIADFYIPSL
jgi:hypothetical protein